jgi:tripartite ATP-independent transporter DctM subunit
MPVIILGCIKFGWATPTEAAVFAAVYALFVGLFIYRELEPSQVYGVFLVAAKTTAAVMLLVAAALISAWLITQANIPAELGSLLEPLKDNPTILLLVVMILVVIVGTALDFAPTVLILTPILMPLVKEAGINPVYFGVLFIMNNAIGLITPPVGIVLNVVCGVARVPMGAVIRGVMPFLLAQTVVLFLLVFLPQWVLAPLAWLRDRITLWEMLLAMAGMSSS